MLRRMKQFEIRSSGEGIKVREAPGKILFSSLLGSVYLDAQFIPQPASKFIGIVFPMP